ncbi:MAG: hypothetical protein HPY80_09640 [Bacteroidales bacterium]|jgi:hypothetical protein|nr:hypothetical protein [Bacteroidales bacterium]NPV36913.1 hypothetical protein [Bacteroidales bacterium]
MATFSYKHIVEDINGVRCSVVETGIDSKRVEFLKNLLELNGFKVQVEELTSKGEGQEPTYKVGVEDLLFNPVVAVYGRRLKDAQGKIITPQFWFQKTEKPLPYYWLQKA